MKHRRGAVVMEKGKCPNFCVSEYLEMEAAIRKSQVTRMVDQGNGVEIAYFQF